MSHVPPFAHGYAKDALIVGSADCGIAEEVVKSITRLTQVEIDASVIEFAKQHFREFTKPVFADRRFEIIIDDGMEYVAATDRRFLPDPILDPAIECRGLCTTAVHCRSHDQIGVNTD